MSRSPIDGRTLLPLVSAGRVLGGLLAERVAEPRGLGRARIAAGIAAQAMEASRLWDSRRRRVGHARPADAPAQPPRLPECARPRAGARQAHRPEPGGVAGRHGRAGRATPRGTEPAEADRVLRLAAGGLAGGVRSYDCVCRLDEGEFALVLPGMTAESAAALVGAAGQRVRSMVAGRRPDHRLRRRGRLPRTRGNQRRACAPGQRRAGSRGRRPRDRLGRGRGGRRRPGAIAGGARRTIGRLARRQRVRGAHRWRLRSRARPRRPRAPGSVARRPGRAPVARMPSAGAWPSAWRPA